MLEQRPRRPLPGIALASGNVIAGVLTGHGQGAASGAPQCRPPGRYRLTLRDRHAGFAEAHSAAFDMGGNLVAEVAVQGRAEPGGLSAATCRPDG